MTLGQRLLHLRKHRKLTQQALATLAGVSQAMVARIESGNVQDPSMTVIRKLALALGITSDYLIGMYEHMNTDDPTPTLAAV